jgi:hypothetical protein
MCIYYEDNHQELVSNLKEEIEMLKRPKNGEHRVTIVFFMQPADSRNQHNPFPARGVYYIQFQNGKF